MYISKEDYTAIVNGRFKSFTCTTCDGNGWYWVYHDGTKRNPGANETHDDFYRHECTGETGCDGLGFRVVVREEA